jgi:hypothetical protein
MAWCALFKASIIAGALLDPVLPMCGGSNTSERGLFPDTINGYKTYIIKVAIGSRGAWLS